MTEAENLNTPGNRSAGRVLGTPLREINKQLPLRVLSAEQFSFWQENGYVVIPNAIAPEEVKATQDFLWEFQEMSPDDPETWWQDQRRDHAMVELNNSGMVECYHHPILWQNRQNERVYNSFVDIWDREDLWVTIDRANLNPPNRGKRAFSGFIHWDSDTSLTPLPIAVQGLLALSDTDEGTGGFQCVPALYHDLETWRITQPSDRDPFQPDISGYKTEFVPMKEGDLLIFNGLLPHGIRPNNSDRVRMAQYISMSPAQPDNEDILSWRLNSFTERTPPMGYAFPGDPRGWEQTRYPAASLTPLGRKLLGKETW